MNFGLKNETLQRITRVFSTFPEVHEVIVYGSRAKGNYKAGSDIDLTIKGEKLNLSTLSKISQQLDDLSLPYTIDLSLFEYIENKDLIDHIQRIGSVLYKTN
jgi:uncharacterized protein